VCVCECVCVCVCVLVGWRVDVTAIVQYCSLISDTRLIRPLLSTDCKGRICLNDWSYMNIDTCACTCGDQFTGDDCSEKKVSTRSIGCRGADI
jgi:hypothetical protein